MREREPFSGKYRGKKPPITSVRRRGTVLIFPGDPAGRELMTREPRQVRVITLPENSHHKLLHRLWNICFELNLEDEITVWWPRGPNEPSDPSSN